MTHKEMLKFGDIYIEKHKFHILKKASEVLRYLQFPKKQFPSPKYCINPIHPHTLLSPLTPPSPHPHHKKSKLT